MKVYYGMQPLGKFRLNNQPISIVGRLTTPLRGTGRSIVTDNWFTSLPLALELRNHNLFLTGTMRANRRQIPQLFVQKMKKRPIQSSIFGHNDVSTLLSYKVKQNKMVVLFSNHPHHQNDEINPNDAKKRPQTITYYNKNKNGVDEVDRLQTMYSES